MTRTRGQPLKPLPLRKGEEETKQTGEEELDPPPLDAPPTSSLSRVPEKHRSVAPYGLPCVRELLRFLISIINSKDRHNSEALVTIGLNLVCAALECSGPVVCQYQSLLLLIQDGLCRNLCTLLQHDSFVVLSRALNLTTPQAATGDDILIDLISSENVKCPMDRRELALECVLQVMLVATELFNKKASLAVEHLVKQGVFTSPPDPEEVASFLHDNQGLHKAMIGDYIGDHRNIDILNAYVGEDASPVQKCNDEGLGKVFANKDAVFVLAYSIIMLNVVL
eukprot:Em0002g1405a